MGIQLEESPEGSENIVEQIVRKKLTFDRIWQQVHVRIIGVKSLHFIESPKVVEILFDLDLQSSCNWLPILKSLKGYEPLV